MAGTFLLGEKKVRPGIYYRREKIGASTAGATNGVLAVLFQSNWGALNTEVDIDQTQLNELEDIFGDGATVIREGLLGGATTVRAIRVGSDDGEVAKLILKTAPAEVEVVTPKELTCTVTEDVRTFSVPADFDEDNFTAYSNGVDVSNDIELGEGQITISEAGVTKLTDNQFKLNWNVTTTETQALDAVELSAAYVGNRSFAVSIRTNLITDKRQLLIYSGTEILAAISFESSGDEAQSLVDALTTNKMFNARKLNAGILSDVTQAPLTGGTNPTVTTSSYERGTNVLERYRWNCIVADSDDSAVNAILTAFVRQSYETGHLGFACIAGKSSQSLEARMSYAAACNDEKIVFVLNGWTSTDGTVYDGWRAAARIGGMIAACETNTSLTHDVISDALTLIEPLTNGEIIRAEQKGCLVLSLNDSDQIWIDSAINTLVTPNANMDDGWKKIRRTKTRFEVMERVNSSCEPLIGSISNDSLGRGTVVGVAQRVLNEMISEGKLFEGSYVEEDSAHKPDGDSAWFLIHIGDVDSIEKLYLTYRFSYSNPFQEG